MRYFKPLPETLEDLRALYKTLATKHHPDVGGDTATMQAINNEYEMLFSRVKDLRRNSKGEVYSKENEETASEYMDIINRIITHQHVTIEIIGSFIWVSGDTKPYKDIYKELGFRWSTNKTAWYKAPKGYRKASRKDWTMNDIRNRFNSETVENKETEKMSA